MNRNLPYISLFLFILSCNSTATHQVTPAFYHWQSDLDISAYEKKTLDSLQVEVLYLRFFDLDWQADGQQVIPVGQLQVDHSLPSRVQVVPTIFITNRTFKNIDKEAIPDLVRKIGDKIRQQLSSLKINQVTEIQFDCDWTQQTRAIYFYFLKMVQDEFRELLISATIRLHQIKYPEQTGVPPVGRGMLMFYNTGNVSDPATDNSILDWSTASKYLGRLPEYPLALDLALPIFSWGCVFRDDKMVRLVNNLQSESLSDTTRFKNIREGWVEVVKSTYLQGYYLYAGDQIRLETVAPETLIFVATRLKEKIANESLRLAYYHLDSILLKNYSYAQFQRIQKTLED